MRIEKDDLGFLEVPKEAYWGIHTRRALGNFPISGLKVSNGLIRAMAVVKKAACLANTELGYLDSEKGRAIAQACEEISTGRFEDSFLLDALQGGAGTSTNMNMNEVLANLALEILGHPKGSYEVIHPLGHVNLHQSTNDVYPTALKVAAMRELKDLSAAVTELQGAFQSKEKEFSKILKMGRTEMEAAVPMTLGAEFSAFSEAVARDRWRTFKCEERIRQINLGGTAIGTGIGAPQRYIFLVTEKLRGLTGLSLAAAENRVDATANADAFVEVSGILKAHAANLIKIAEDLRRLMLLDEITLPRLQVGSSIMPGKLNPVLLEAVIQTALKVIANDGLVTECATRASFQICEFMPLLAHALLESLEILKRINPLFAKYVLGITANDTVCRKTFENAPELITSFLPLLGYEGCHQLLEEFRASGRTSVVEFLNEKLGKEKVGEYLAPAALMQLGYRDHGKRA